LELLNLQEAAECVGGMENNIIRSLDSLNVAMKEAGLPSTTLLAPWPGHRDRADIENILFQAFPPASQRLKGSGLCGRNGGIVSAAARPLPGNLGHFGQAA
jgi:hypothetical protein